MKKVSTSFLIIAAIFFFKPNFLNAQINTNDSLALVSFYNSTGGTHWNYHQNWLTSVPVSKWAGITVTNNRVTKIKLVRDNVKGSIPPALGNLSKLNSLILFDNGLSGSIPIELFNLTNLTTLILFNNQLSGNIPPELSNLTKLTSLDLGRNKLSGSIPPELGNLITLKHLNLRYNQLTGSIPPELSNLINLYNLNLKFNQLTGSIPSQFVNLSKLTHLILNNNQLSGNIPRELGNLTKLTALQLYSNQLSGSIPPELGNLTKLHPSLNLSNNQLSGNIPPELSKLTKLTGLALSNNQLTGSIPPELGNLSNLNFEYLYLDHNKLSGSIPPELGKLQWLITLHLEHNKLSGNIPPELFKNYLSNLFLEHNQLSGSIPPELSEHHFYILHLNNNRLSGRVPDFETYTTYIYLQENKFTFAGLLKLVKANRPLVYAPQANIPIHQNGNILSVYTGGSYQLTYDTFKWYKDGNLIATINADSVFVPTVSGRYNVTVTNSIATELTLYSDTINYTASDNSIALKLNNNSSISIYPNPAKSFTTISFNTEGKYAITIADVSGKILQTKTGVAIKGKNIIQLDVSKYASGVYLITIMDEKNKKQTLRLNKE